MTPNTPSSTSSASPCTTAPRPSWPGIAPSNSSASIWAEPVAIGDQGAGLDAGAAPVATRYARSLRPWRQAVVDRGDARLSFTFLPKWIRGNERVLALGNLNLVSDSMQACEQMMLRGDAKFLLCHYHKDISSPVASGQSNSHPAALISA